MANPRGNFKLSKPMKTGQSHWELYASIDKNHPDRRSIDPLDKLVEASQFKKFVEYAKEQGWKYENNGYTIPEGNCFYFVEPIIICRRATEGLFRLNELDIYLPFDFDCLDLNEYEDFGLEEML